MLVDPDAGELEENPSAAASSTGLGYRRRRVVRGTSSARAFDEEEGDLRVAVDRSRSAQCDGEVVAPTLERAYASYVVDERYAAIDAASRRADVELLERALRDTDGRWRWPPPTACTARSATT